MITFGQRWAKCSAVCCLEQAVATQWHMNIDTRPIIVHFCPTKVQLKSTISGQVRYGQRPTYCTFNGFPEFRRLINRVCHNAKKVVWLACLAEAVHLSLNLLNICQLANSLTSLGPDLISYKEEVWECRRVPWISSVFDSELFERGMFIIQRGTNRWEKHKCQNRVWYAASRKKLWKI